MNTSLGGACFGSQLRVRTSFVTGRCLRHGDGTSLPVKRHTRPYGHVATVGEGDPFSHKALLRGALLSMKWGQCETLTRVPVWLRGAPWSLVSDLWVLA